MRLRFDRAQGGIEIALLEGNDLTGAEMVYCAIAIAIGPWTWEWRLECWRCSDG